MSSHLLNRSPRQQVLWRTGAAMLLALLAAIFSAGTSHAAPPEQVNPCNQPGIATIIDPAGGAIQVNMLTPGSNVPINDPTSIQKIVLTGGQTIYGYCVDSNEARQNNVQVCLVSEITNVRLAYLIAKYPPDLNNNINMAARQAAVWHYSNGKNLASPDATTQGPTVDAQVLSIYNALLTEVNAIDPANPPVSCGRGTWR